MPHYSDSFYYDEKAGYLSTACRLRHTVILAVLQRRGFWILTAFHLSVSMGLRAGYDHCLRNGSQWNIGWHSISVISTMTIFFQVFYTNECWKRYTSLYDQTRGMLHTVFDFITELRLLVGRISKKHLRLSVRYLLSSVMVFFYEMDDVIQEYEWTQLLRLRLITREEIRVLQKLTLEEKTICLVHWCADVACDGHSLAMKKNNVPPNLRQSLLDRLLRIRRAQQRVRDVRRLPVPFQYFHLLNWMLTLNLLLWAYHMGCSHSPIDNIIYICASLVFLGMMELASAFADPFGNDEVDFPVGKWMTLWLGQCVTLVEYSYPGEADHWGEALKSTKPLDKELINLDIFMDCGFADSPQADFVDKPRQVWVEGSWHDKLPAVPGTCVAASLDGSSSSDDGPVRATGCSTRLGGKPRHT